jgi:hypothetical protein
VPTLDAGDQTFVAISEASGGSDPAHAIQMRAERKGDRYVLNGSKMWIAGVDEGKWGLVFARTGPSKGRDGITAFGSAKHDMLMCSLSMASLTLATNLFSGSGGIIADLHVALFRAAQNTPIMSAAANLGFVQCSTHYCRKVRSISAMTRRTFGDNG